MQLVVLLDSLVSPLSEVQWFTVLVQLIAQVNKGRVLEKTPPTSPSWSQVLLLHDITEVFSLSAGSEAIDEAAQGSYTRMSVSTLHLFCPS